MNLAIKISLRLFAASTPCKAGGAGAGCLLAARLSLPGFPRRPPPEPSTCWQPPAPSWESPPARASRSRRRGLASGYLGPFPPAGCSPLGERGRFTGGTRTQPVAGPTSQLLLGASQGRLGPGSPGCEAPRPPRPPEAMGTAPGRVHSAPGSPSVRAAPPEEPALVPTALLGAGAGTALPPPLRLARPDALLFGFVPYVAFKRPPGGIKVA